MDRPDTEIAMSNMNKTTLRVWSDPDGLSSVVRVRFRSFVAWANARRVKRVLDVSLSLLGGLLALPLIVLIAVAIKLTSRGPVFYCQSRVGQGGREFVVRKFRSMVESADQELIEFLQANPLYAAEWRSQQKVTNDPRTTWLGRILRKTSLDELPQLWNVLRGEMSLVGPRPICRNEIAKYGTSYEQYQQVRPGITGLWQVSGRSHTTYEQRVEFDTYYVRNWTLGLDLSILFRTVWVVLSTKGAY
jgi:Undecaprenyl-phosphate galactose phosphotransferase WbaP